MNYDSICFEDFMSYDSKLRKKIINDPELIKIMLRKNVSESRYNHSLSVADLCYKLALKHKVDPDRAYMAGLLHDVCKFTKDKEHLLVEYLKYYDPDKLKESPGIHHSYVGKYYLREMTNYHDSKILNAIYNHTICRSKDKLSLIVYIADKREPLRNINDEILDIAYKDLYKAYQLLNKDVERYIKEVKNERFITDSL